MKTVLAEKENYHFMIYSCSNYYIKEREEITAEDEFIVIKYIYSRLNKIKKTNPEFYEEIRDKTGIELRITKIEKYVSIVEKNRKSSIRKGSQSNKYRINYKPSFLKCTI